MKRKMPLDRGVARHQFKEIECTSTSPKRVARIATRNIEYKTNLEYTLSKKTQATKPYIPPELGKSAKNLKIEQIM